MHISAFVNANWVRDERFIRAERVGELAKRALENECGLAVHLMVSDTADSRSLDACPVSTSAVGMPQSGDLSEGFLIADKAKATINNFRPSEKEWTDLPWG